MKAFQLILLTFLISCGGGGGGGSESTTTTGGDETPSTCTTNEQAVGTWNNNSINETLVINSSCRVTSDYCNSIATISDTSEQNAYDNNSITITVHSNNGLSECLPVGTHSTCLYSLVTNQAGTIMTYGCTGIGTAQYTKQL